MFNNNIAKQQIVLDCEYASSTEIGNNIKINGKSYYAPVFADNLLQHVNLYFRVKYKNTKSAVSRDKLPFKEFINNAGWVIGENVVDLVDFIDHRVYTHINSGKASEQYIVYFVTTKDENELYEGYLVFNDPTDKDFKAKFSGYELKLIKYLKKVLNS